VECKLYLKSRLYGVELGFKLHFLTPVYVRN